MVILLKIIILGIDQGEDFWKEKDKVFYEQRESMVLPENQSQKQTPSHDNSYNQKPSFSEKELAQKREWIRQMKKSLQNSQNEYFIATSPEHQKEKFNGIFTKISNF